MQAFSGDFDLPGVPIRLMLRKAVRSCDLRAFRLQRAGPGVG